MAKDQPHQCQCEKCTQTSDHPDKEMHQQINLFISRLDEQQRRWYVGLESKKIGHGGDQLVSRITGVHVQTIRRARRELDVSLEERPVDRVRLEGGGRPRVEKKTRA